MNKPTTQSPAVQDQTVNENKRILVIEDDQDIANLIALHLADIYREVRLCHDGLDGLALASGECWDLIVLDLRLPRLDGLEICRRIRATDIMTPILMLTSKSSELDHVLGLEMGADDYVTKPFSVITLRSRIKAILRRVSTVNKASALSEQTYLSHKGIEVDSGKRTVVIDGRQIELTAKEFQLLCFFMLRPGQVFSRAVLLDEVWGYGHEGYEHTVNSHINRLRTKIEENPTQPQFLVTVWGVGYKLSE
ncbi:MAG: response regulator transcription factor [Gammaproteobacteria bacterium]|jgi:DNA-binding response OmpR family regulator|nr:response regulator transcription factor [Gammaproteobacteria bacterium]MBT4494401.1 response regulator transcription factor [Gammaproteobacteria bacterium]